MSQLFMTKSQGDLNDEDTDELLERLSEIGASFGVVIETILAGDLEDPSVRYAPVGQIVADAAGW